MKDLPNEEKPKIWSKSKWTTSNNSKRIRWEARIVKNEKLNQQLAEETIDVTLPSRQISIGSKHPLTRTVEEIEDLFLGLGYEIVDGYEVEQDYYNFEALNLL